VDKRKSNEAKLNAQSEAHQAKVEHLRKKLAEMSENFELAKAKQEVSEWTSSRLEKNVEDLRSSREKCYEVSMDCAKKLKDSFAKVGAYSSEQKFIRGDPEGVIQWIGEEVEALEEILSDRGDFCAFTGARGVAAVLEKTGCEHVKAAAQVLGRRQRRHPSLEAFAAVAGLTETKRAGTPFAPFGTRRRPAATSSRSAASSSSEAHV
jgi:seryl-tRNA synthetase